MWQLPVKSFNKYSCVYMSSVATSRETLAELTFTLQVKRPHGSTFLVDVLSQTLNNIKHLTLKPLLSKDSFHFKNLFLSPSIVSLIRTKSSSYSNSLSTHILSNLVTTSTTTAKGKGDSTDPWCLPHYDLKLLWQLIIHSNSCLCSLIQTHHSSNRNLWYSHLSHCQFPHFPWFSVKSFLQVHKALFRYFFFSFDTLLASFSR